MAHKYRVSGAQPVEFDGTTYKPGDEFSADIGPEQEQQLVDSGAIEPFRKAKTDDTSEKEG